MPLGTQPNKKKNSESGVIDHALFAGLFWLAVAGVFGLLVIAIKIDSYLLLGGSLLFLFLLVYIRWIAPYRLTLARHVWKFGSSDICLRLVFLSDLHAGMEKGSQWQARAAKVVQDLKPDVVIFGGDFVESEKEAIQECQTWQQVHAPLGTYFVLGNHDYLDDPAFISKQLQAWKFTPLLNQEVVLEKQGRTLRLVGTDDTWYGRPDLSWFKLSETPALLVSHEPDILLDIQPNLFQGALFGHTHGGQVRFPCIGPLCWLPQTAPQWLDRGEKKWNGLSLIISHGLGESTLSLRWFCPPQIVMVEIWL